VIENDEMINLTTKLKPDLMKKFFKITGIVLGSLIGVIIISILIFNGYYWGKNLKAKKQLHKVQMVTENGFQFRDLNKNGKLDVTKTVGKILNCVLTICFPG
jgi:hypothetical protein